jgi:hypothetical protein
MLADRTKTTLAAIAVLAIVGSTSAEAHCFIHGKSSGGYSKAASYRPAVKKASVKPRAQPAAVARSKPAPKVAVAAARPVVVASAAATPVPAKNSSTDPACLSKEYLDTGEVMFRDTCAREWAINAADVATDKRTTAAACLSKEVTQSGLIMFRDTCTNEWARSTQKRAEAAQQSRAQ